MMAPKHKVREDEEDISQLRKPITIHGKPVEQILNSIHYGSPELKSLLLHECDIIFECKLCRALFRDLPNFIAHKRRYCCKSAVEVNHFAISELPDEKVVVVQPKPPADSRTRAANVPVQSSSSSSHSGLEDILQRIRSGEAGNSNAFKVYSNAAAKLQHQRENARISRIRTTEIPGNPNAVFVDVNTTSVNIHDRPSARKEGASKSKSCVKTITAKAGLKNRRREKPSLRSKMPNKSNEESVELTDILMRELKAIQNKVKNKNQAQKPEKAHMAQRVKESIFTTPGCDFETKQHAQSEKHAVENVYKTSKSTAEDMGLVEVARLTSKAVSVKQDKTMADGDPGPSSKASSDSGVILNTADSKQSKRSLICSKCRTIFSSRKSLQFHMKVQHAIKRTFYPCPMCSSVYSYFNAVTRHLLRNHDKSKAEINAMREELKSKAFTKRVQSQSQESVRSAKRNLTGTRQSLRYKTTLPQKKSNNASYFYSLVKKGKNVPVNSDPVLHEVGKKAVKSEVSGRPPVVNTSVFKTDTSGGHGDRIDKKEEIKPPVVHSKPTRSQVKIDVFASIIDVPRTQVKAVNRVSSPTRSSADIDSVMQRCMKCSKLFGRKATYEKHIKTCGESSSVNSPSANSDFSSVSPSGIHVENLFISTRNRSKDLQIASPQLPPIAERRSRRSSTSSFKDEVDSSSEAKSVAIDKRSKANHGSISHGTDNACQKLEFPKKADQAKQVPSNGKQHAMPPKLEEDSSGDHIDGISLQKLSPEISFTVTRLKSKTASELVAVKSEGSPLCAVSPKMDPNVLLDNDLAQKISLDTQMQRLSKGDSINTSLENATSKEPGLPERPRRKRKVPSRNIGAEEFLQKIHRVDRDEPVKKKVRISSLSNDSRPQNVVSPISPVKTTNVKSLYRAAEQVKKESVNNATRSRVTANKMFVLRSGDSGGSRSKLQCYNHSKVEKWMDLKKIACVKCGQRFSFIHNLKRHVVRTHLKWSRFQCKLCNFTSFDKSECTTHIVRSHRHGLKPDRKQFFNSLITDLAKQGSKAMTLKKRQTLKAKSQQQDNENIYRNQNAQKVPRLSERTLKSDALETSPASVIDISSEKQKRQQRVDTKTEMVNGETNRKLQTPSPSAVCLQGRRTLRVSHLVARSHRSSSPSSFSIGPSSVDKNNCMASGLKLSDKESSERSTSPLNAPHVNSAVSARRAPTPFNISTRNSPRVFDTTPYPREELAAVEEQAQHGDLQTRPGNCTKTPVDKVKEKSECLSDSKKPDIVTQDEPDHGKNRTSGEQTALDKEPKTSGDEYSDSQNDFGNKGDHVLLNSKTGNEELEEKEAVSNPALSGSSPNVSDSSTCSTVVPATRSASCSLQKTTPLRIPSLDTVSSSSLLSSPPSSSSNLLAQLDSENCSKSAKSLSSIVAGDGCPVEGENASSP